MTDNNKMKMIDSRCSILDGYFLKIFVTVLLVILVCAKRNEFQKIRDGDFDIITKGTYHGTTIFLRQGGEHNKLITDLRTEIERNMDILPVITEKFFFVSGRLIYKFKFAALDAGKSYLILRYFARIMNHPIYAGYQIQFVFSLNKKQLMQICTAEVPLE